MKLELPFTENTIEETSLVLDMLSLGYLLDFQVGMPESQLDILIWNSRETWARELGNNPFEDPFK